MNGPRAFFPFLLSIVVAAFFAPGSAQTRELAFRERVEAQRAIERVYYAHQISASRSFEEAVPQSLLERKVATYLEQSAALERFWNTPVTAAALQAEWTRIARSSRFPERLEEIYAALGRDPVLIQETFVRSVLVDRLSRSFFKTDERIHGVSRREIESLRERLESGALLISAEDPHKTILELLRGADDPARLPPSGEREARGRAGSRIVGPAEFDRWRASIPKKIGEIGKIKDEGDAWNVRVLLGEGEGWIRIARYSVPKLGWDEWWREKSEDYDEQEIAVVAWPRRVLPPSSTISLPSPETTPSCIPADSWDNGILDAAPRPASDHTAIWTGSLMVVWGGTSDETPTGLGARYDPLTDTWSPTSTMGAPSLRSNATAVWTGQKMIVWGGTTLDTNNDPLSTGGRYDPVTDSWQPVSTSGAPLERFAHTAVWTGTVMVIWGGEINGYYLSDGGRYNPASDTWSPVSTLEAPSAREYHTAIWTGSRMVVWGGYGPAQFGPAFLNTGGLYDPVADSWVGPTTLTNAPSLRMSHIAIWTGSRMIVWGGWNTTYPDAGGRYDPVLDAWSPMSTLNGPQGRANATAIWTGTDMIVWGGGLGQPGTGGVYNPSNDTWSPTSLINAPPGRIHHTAIWTGDKMIVWGGWTMEAAPTNTGGRYDPASDTWTPTWTTGEVERAGHTAVWTGNEMILWGGGGMGVDAPANVSTGARYSPVTDSWTPTTLSGAPSARNSHSAVWAGNEMIVWGGQDGNYPFPNTGGRYNPTTDTWSSTTTLNAPAGRRLATAVWTGTEMIVWGGESGVNPILPVDTGGRYNPTTDTWVATSPGPVRRVNHSAVWTGSRMIVWGGEGGSPLAYQNTGALYDPGSNSWTPTSTVDAPSARTYQTAIWTGDRMIIWGGFPSGPNGPTNTGARYDPSNNSWSPVSTVGAPSARYVHSAVWLSGRMIIWGGAGVGYLNTGGRYDPLADSWSETSILDAPAPRYQHTAISAGNLMIVWGGYNANEFEYHETSSGGRYAPSTIDQGADSDGDGFSICTDCNDSAASVHPGAVEVCNGVDDNCNGVSDEGFPDQDADGFAACLDCQDGDPSVHPGAVEVCNLIDDNCNGETDEGFDLDGDGYTICTTGECNDSDPGAWAEPFEPFDLMLTSGAPVDISWMDQGPIVGAAVAYDLVSGPLSSTPGLNFSSASCLQSGASNSYQDNRPTPTPGSGYWYLVRARNSCATAAYGFSTSGAERVITACP